MMEPKASNNMEMDLKDSENVGKLVASLPEDTVSMAWRSQLNQKLLETSKRKTRTWSWLWRPAVGMAFAGALALVVMLPRSQPVATLPNGKIEAEMLAAHQQVVQLRDVSESRLTAFETTGGQAGYTYSEVDLGTL